MKLKTNFKILLLLGILLSIALIIIPINKSMAVVRTDEVSDGDNTGIVINGVTIVENGKVVENINNVSYDTESNTLTLDNFKGNSVRWVGMGKNFRINIVGENIVGEEDKIYPFSGPMAGDGNIMFTNVKFIGNGKLNIISTLANIGDLEIDGPTISVNGAVYPIDGKLSVKRGTLSIKATHKYFDKAFNGENIEFDNNIDITDGNGKPLYYVKKELEYTIEERENGEKIYWVDNGDGHKSGYNQIPYVQNFCYTKEYSEENVSDNVVMKEKKVSLNKKESTTNIKLDTDSNIVPSNTTLVTSIITNSETLNTIKESLKKVTTKYVTYDIKLESNNVVIQPNGNVKISIPIPNNYDKTKLAVYRIDDNGNKTEYTVKTDGDYATFETNHFSTYVLAEKSKDIPQETSEPQVTTPTQTVDKGEKDETPKTGTVDIIGYVCLITLVSLVGIVELKKRLK